MYLLSLTSMVLVYIGLTVSIEQVVGAKSHKHTNTHASVAALFFIYAHSPCYNIGNNALTYSKYLKFASKFSV
jgi:hypothetical protein